MFKHTFASVNLIKRELSFFTFVMSLISTLFTLGFLSFSLVEGRGYFALNLILIIFALLNFAVYAVLHALHGREARQVKRLIKHCMRISKILLSAIPLFIIVYTLAFTSAELSRLELVFLPLMILFWMAQVIFEVCSLYAESRLALFADAIKMDVEGVVNPILKLRNAIKGESYRTDGVHVSDRNRAKILEELDSEAQPEQEAEEPTQKKDDFFTRLTKTGQAIKELIKK